MTAPMPRSIAPCCSPAASALSMAAMMPFDAGASSPCASAADFLMICQPSSSSLLRLAPGTFFLLISSTHDR
jgi:hypothetical protein